MDIRGDGIYGLVFYVSDLEKETAKLAGKEVQVMAKGKSGAGNSFVYFDTRKPGNIIIKLIEAELTGTKI